MKQLIFTASFCMVLGSCQHTEQTTDSIASSMLKNSVESYTGKHASQLVLDSKSKLKHLLYYHEDAPSILDGIFLIYENGIALRVRFSQIQGMSRRNSNENWDINMCLYQKVSSISVVSSKIDEAHSMPEIRLEFINCDSIRVINSESEEGVLPNA